MGLLQRRIRHAVLHVVAHPRLTLLIAGIFLAASVTLSLTRLGISSDENKLFSTKVKFFRDFLEFQDKFPENDALYVIVEPTDQNKIPPVRDWTRVADELADGLRALPDAVEAVDTHIPVEKMGSQGILFADDAKVKESFTEFKRFTALIQLFAEKPSLVQSRLLGSNAVERFLTAFTIQLSTAPAEPTMAPLLGIIADSWLTALQHPSTTLTPGHGLPDFVALDADDPQGLGYYYIPDESDPKKHLLLVRVYPKTDYASLTSISQTVESIRRVINETGKRYPQFTFSTTGRPALSADEMTITDRDSNRAEIVALSIVFIVMALVLSSIWLALAAELSLAVGIGWTFGWATLAVGELNLLSIVFLIALIGIGMDYLVQILTAYRREAQRRVRAQAIWARVFISVGPPINTACMGAAGAFLVSALTDFRGAAHLGIIAGGGLLLCLLAGYTVLPALLTLFPPKLRMIDAAERYAGTPAPIGGWRLLFPIAWISALIVGAIFFAPRTRFNPNLLDLQAPDTLAMKPIRKLQLWSAVVLSKDLKQLRLARDAIANSPLIADTDSVLDAFDNYQWLQSHKSELPPIAWSAPAAVIANDLPSIASKADGLATRLAAAFPASDSPAVLRHFADALRTTPNPDPTAERLSEWQSAFVGQLHGLVDGITPPPPDIAALPAELRSHYVSDYKSDPGDYALYITPRGDLWKQENLEPFVRDLDTRLAHIPGLTVTGVAPEIYHTTNAIRIAFYKATAYAIGLIFILVLIDLRNLRQTLLAISVLALGLPMLVALMGLFHIDWNFANFFGLPILIGAGHEYGVFLVHRYREAAHDPRRFWRHRDASDRALLLCAFVTSSSFGFFWALGHHRGLKSLGLVMAIGTACIYMAAVLVVRPILLWQLHRQKA